MPEASGPANSGAPVITSGTQAGAVKEDTTLTATGGQAKCVEPTADRLRELSDFAFAGTVTAIDGDAAALLLEFRHIDQQLKIAREDAPWVWGYHPKDYGLAHAWVKNVKPNQMARNGRAG